MVTVCTCDKNGHFVTVYKTGAIEMSEVVIAELTLLYLIGIVENKRRTSHVTTDSGQTVGHGHDG